MLPKPFLLVCFCSTKDLRCLLVDKVWFLSLWIAGSQERPQAEGPETTGDLGLSLPSSVLPSCRLTGWEVLGWWRDPWRHCWLVTNLWFIFFVLFWITCCRFQGATLAKATCPDSFSDCPLLEDSYLHGAEVRRRCEHRDWFDTVSSDVCVVW